jgi:hypothetical protein
MFTPGIRERPRDPGHSTGFVVDLREDGFAPNGDAWRAACRRAVTVTLL